MLSLKAINSFTLTDNVSRSNPLSLAIMICGWWVGSVFSSSLSSSSYNFSPGRRPVYLICISLPSVSPDSMIIFFARSTIFIDCPMSKINISPPLPMAPASSTSWHASGMVMKYLVISGWVTVTGPPLLIWSLNNGITEPFDPRTLPKRVVMKRVPFLLFIA